MKKEDFFEVLGELDDDIVKGAKTTMKKKNWKTWGAAAACLVLVLTVGVFVFHAHQDGEVTVEPGVADAAPMVYVNDTLPATRAATQTELQKKISKQTTPLLAVMYINTAKTSL